MGGETVAGSRLRHCSPKIESLAQVSLLYAGGSHKTYLSCVLELLFGFRQIHSVTFRLAFLLFNAINAFLLKVKVHLLEPHVESAACKNLESLINFLPFGHPVFSWSS